MADVRPWPFSTLNADQTLRIVSEVLHELPDWMRHVFEQRIGAKVIEAGFVCFSTEETFTCPRCGMVSHNPTDKAEGYCGNCCDWTLHGS